MRGTAAGEGVAILVFGICSEGFYFVGEERCVEFGGVIRRLADGDKEVR